MNNRIIITSADVGLRKIELARNAMHIKDEVTRNEKSSEIIISFGNSPYLYKVALEITP